MKEGGAGMKEGGAGEVAAHQVFNVSVDVLLHS